MGTKISVSVDTKLEKYPKATATFDGTNTPRFWHDPVLRKSLADAINLAGDNKDIFDYCNFLFSHVNNAIRRRYGGQELQLESVTVIGQFGDNSITSYQ